MSRENVTKSLVVLALALGTVAVVPLDVRVSKWFETEGLPGDVRTGIRLAEAYAHGLSVAAIAVSVGIASRSWRPAVWLLACSFGSGLVANFIKLNVARLRPYANTLTNPDTVWPGFSGWLPWWKAEPGWFDHAMQSFPSGHMATAVGLAWGLTALYPQGRVWWLVLAGLAGVQRIEAQAHYPSDVLAGALVGMLVGEGMLRFSGWILGSGGTGKGKPRGGGTRGPRAS